MFEMFARRGVAMSFLLTVFVSVVVGSTAQTQPAIVLAASSGPPIRLSSTPTRVVIAPMSQAIGPREAAADQQVFLVIDGLSATAAPGATYDVFLGPAAGAAPARDDPSYAGTLNFFDISAMTPIDVRTVSFDVTSLLARLRQNGEMKNPLAVTFIPDAPPLENSEPTFARLRLIIP
jgi:hypothetical protein